jgi:hypothetical protein
MGIAAVSTAATIAAGAATTASAIDGMVSGGPGSTSVNGAGGSVPTGYQPTAQPQFDQYYQQLVGSMLPYATDVPNQTMLRNQQAYQALSNNPYGGTAQNAANSAGAYATGTLAPMERAGAASLQGLGNTAAGYAPQILQTGFDPQNALYDRTQQQLKDQLSATNAQSGLSGTPYGAGVMGQGLSNFNIDWQNQQLQRQLQATQGYGNLTSTAGKGYAGAAELGGLATSTETMGGNLPYSTYAGQQNDVINAGNSYAGAANNAFGLDQNTLNALSAYLKLGQFATQIGQKGQGQAFDQGQTLGGNVGAGLSRLSSGLSGLSSIFGNNNPSSTPTYDPNNPFSSGWSSAPPGDPMAMGGFGFPVGGQG